VSELRDENQEPVFKVCTGEPQLTVSIVNRALEEYVVVNWNWSVCDGRLILSALMISQREVRKAQLATMAPSMGGHRQ